MKKIILSLAILFASIISFAQPDNYVFTVTKNVPYVNLVSPTVVTTTNWDDFDAQIPLGFNFTFMGGTTDSLFFDSNDINSGTDLQFTTSTLSTSPFNFISWMYDLVDRHNNDANMSSFVSYKTDVVATKKITKIEWKNVGVFEDTLNVDSANVQLWLYQDQNALEYRFGKCSRNELTALIKDPTSYGFGGPVFGFVKNADLTAGTFDWFYYASNITTPAMDSIDFTDFSNAQNFVGADSFPNTNTVLRWAPAINSGVNTVSLNKNISVSPTLFTNGFSIEFKEKSNYNVSMIDLNGKILFTKKMNLSTEYIDMSAFAKGNYILMLSNDTERIMYKLTKE